MCSSRQIKKFVGEGTLKQDRRWPRQKTSCGRKGLEGPKEAARYLAQPLFFNNGHLLKSAFS